MHGWVSRVGSSLPSLPSCGKRNKFEPLFGCCTADSQTDISSTTMARLFLFPLLDHCIAALFSDRASALWKQESVLWCMAMAPTFLAIGEVDKLWSTKLYPETCFEVYNLQQREMTIYEQEALSHLSMSNLQKIKYQSTNHKTILFHKSFTFVYGEMKKLTRGASSVEIDVERVERERERER